MANLLGHKAWNRTKKCKRINCCNRPRWERSAQRMRETRAWKAVEEVPGYTSPHDPLIDESDCRHGCNGDCHTSGSDRCTISCHPEPEC